MTDERSILNQFRNLTDILNRSESQFPLFGPVQNPVWTGPPEICLGLQPKDFLEKVVP